MSKKQRLVIGFAIIGILVVIIGVNQMIKTMDKKNEQDIQSAEASPTANTTPTPHPDGEQGNTSEPKDQGGTGKPSDRGESGEAEHEGESEVGSGDSSTSNGAGSAGQGEEKGSDTQVDGTNQAPSAGETELSEDQKKAKAEADAAANTSLASLQSSCVAATDDLLSKALKAVGKIDKDAEDRQKLILAELQTNVLPQVAAKEAECDSKFAAIVSEAKDAYTAADIPDSQLPSWSSEYAKTKASMQSKAVSKLLGAM